MKIFNLYVCEKCNKKSLEREDIELCEARHMGLYTLDEKRAYDELERKVMRTCGALGRAQNPSLLEAQDEAIKKLLEFEKEHNMVTD